MDIRNGQFLLGDCLQIMPTLPAGSVDMVLCDLPYGTTRNAWDSVLPLDDFWRETWRLLPERGPAVLTASQPFTSALVMSAPREFRYDWVWEKNNPSGHLNAKTRPLRCHEDILVFGRKSPFYAPQKTSGHPRKTVKSRDGSSSNYGSQKSSGYSSTDRYPRSVQKVPVVTKGKNQHPTQKPVALFEYLIRTYSEPGAVVLDMTAGSGTTAIAAERAGRRWLCIERDEGYYWQAVARLLGGDD